MTSCCPRRRMRWSGATGAIARCKNKSTGCARRCRSVHAWHWICGVKPTPKVVNKASPHSIVHGLDKPGVFTTVSDGAQAAAHYRQALALAEELGMRPLQAHCHLGLGTVYSQ